MIFNILTFLMVIAANLAMYHIGYNAGVKDICREIDKSLEEIRKQKEDESGNDKENATM